MRSVRRIVRNNRHLTGAKRERLVLLVVVVGELLAAWSVSAQEQQIGYVLNLRGTWVLNSSRQLTGLDPVPAGGSIQLRGRVGGDFIEIVDKKGVPIPNATLHCDVDRCDRRIKLPTAIHRNVVVRWIAAAFAMITDYPALTQSAPIPRGTELKEAVVKIEKEQVNLDSVVANLGRGKYLLRFEPVTSSAQRDIKFIGPVTVDRQNNKSALVSIKGLSPGLYIARPFSYADREPLELGTESMVLFAAPDDYDRDVRQFDEAVKLTNSWGTSIRHASTRMFLRAVLASLVGNPTR